MDRVRVTLTGGAMGSGLSTYYFTAGTAASHLDELHDLWAAAAGNMPSSVSIRVPASGEVLDQSTGAITGTWSGTAPAVVTGAATGYAAGVGMRARWFTNLVVAGRHCVGSTFFIPLATGAYEADGSIQPATVSAMQTAINTFTAACAGDQLIWHRGATGAGTGITGNVLSGILVDRVSWLRSRRT